MKYVSLTQVCDFQGGSQPPKDQWIDHKEDGYIRMLQIRDFTQPDKDNIEFVRINKTIKTCKEDDILIGRYGASVGKILTGLAGAYNVAIIKTIPDTSKLSKRFLYHYLNSTYFQNFILSVGSRAAQAGFNKDDLSDAQIPSLSLEEQKDIVIQLDKISGLIALRKEQLTKLDQLVKSRFIELFGDQESNPFGWEQCSIGECCTLKSGTSLPAEVENEGGPIPYVKVGDMNYPGNERYITTSSRYVSEETAGKGLFEVGSVLFPKRGGAIGTNKKRMTQLPVCADLNVMGVSSNGKLLPEYLFVYFDLVDLGALADGSSVPQINNKNIAPLAICLPPMELQKPKWFCI